MPSTHIPANCLGDVDFFSSQETETNSSIIDVLPQTPPNEEWLNKVSSTPLKDISLAPLKNTITKHTPLNVSIIKKPQRLSLSSPTTNMGITSIDLENGINFTYDISHGTTASQQDPEIVVGETVSSPSKSQIKAAESSTVLAPMDTAIEESKTARL